jgi:mannosyltransferase OCH1-like enzyme
MESWEKYCPDYKFQLWNEDNFPFDEYPFAKQALADKKWAYISDVARLHSLYYFGGIYMDTDVQVFQPIDQFLNEDFFSGYETPRKIPTAIMGSRAGNKYLGKLLLWYIGKSYSKAFYKVPNVKIISKFTERYYDVKLDGNEFSLPDGAHFYPSEYFCHPVSGSGNSYTQHHFDGSWVNAEDMVD